MAHHGNKVKTLTALAIAMTLTFNTAVANIPNYPTPKEPLPSPTDTIQREIRLQAQNIQKCIILDHRFAELINKGTTELKKAYFNLKIEWNKTNPNDDREIRIAPHITKLKSAFKNLKTRVLTINSIQTGPDAPPCSLYKKTDEARYWAFDVDARIRKELTPPNPK